MNKILNLFRIPDIRKKILVVLGLLLIFRIFASIPIPGVDTIALQTFFNNSQLLSFLNIFSGGGLSNLSIAMLGVGPYITATIIMQLLTMIFPNLKKLYYEEGEQGRAKFNRISRYLTVPLSALQGFGFLNLLMAQHILPGLSRFSFPMLTNVLIVTAGTMILVWLGELITEQKIGNGVSLIIFAGIISRLPLFIGQELSKYFGPGATTSELPTHLAFLAIGIIVTAGVVFIQQGERKIPVSYARRVRGNKIYGGVASYLPLKVNQAGVIPIIFAISLLLFPQFFAQIIATIISPDLGARVEDLVNKFLANQLLYGTSYFVLVVAFTYFYTFVTFDPQEISKNLQKSGGFIPGIRPGESTGQFLSKIINRITLFGALFLGAIAVLPIAVQGITGSSKLTIGGTSMLIVVAVALEIMSQIDSQLTIREYEGLN